MKIHNVITVPDIDDRIWSLCINWLLRYGKDVVKLEKDAEKNHQDLLELKGLCYEEWLDRFLGDLLKS